MYRTQEVPREVQLPFLALRPDLWTLHPVLGPVGLPLQPVRLTL